MKNGARWVTILNGTIEGQEREGGGKGGWGEREREKTKKRERDGGERREEKRERQRGVSVTSHLLGTTHTYPTNSLIRGSWFLSLDFL
jgi:hypothetical protein